MNFYKKFKNRLYLFSDDLFFYKRQLSYFGKSRKLYKILSQKDIKTFFALLNDNHFRMEIHDMNLVNIIISFYYNKTPLLRIYYDRTKNTHEIKYFCVTFFLFEKKKFDLSFLFDLRPKIDTICSLLETLLIEPKNNDTAIFKNTLFQRYPEIRNIICSYNILNHIEISGKNRERYVINIFRGDQDQKTIQIKYYPFNKNRNIFYCYSKEIINEYQE